MKRKKQRSALQNAVGALRTCFLHFTHVSVSTPQSAGGGFGSARGGDFLAAGVRNFVLVPWGLFSFFASLILVSTRHASLEAKFFLRSRLSRLFPGLTGTSSASCLTWATSACTVFKRLFKCILVSSTKDRLGPSLSELVIRCDKAAMPQPD